MDCTICEGWISSQDGKLVTFEGTRYWVHETPELCLDSMKSRELL